MTKHQIILDRLTAWVEKQSSVGPAAFKGMREEIEREVAREPIPLEQLRQSVAQSIKDGGLPYAVLPMTLNDGVTQIERELRSVEMRELFRHYLDFIDQRKLSGRFSLVTQLRRVEPWEPTDTEAAQAEAEEQLAKEMGEFARDELGATVSDVDEAIARDKAREMEETRAPLRYPLDSPEARAILEPSSEALGPGAPPDDVEARELGEP